MVNPSRDKGTRAETRVVEWLKARRFAAYRPRLAGAKDVGDIHIDGATVIIEVKWSASNPTAGQVDQWLAEAATEAQNYTVAQRPVMPATYYPVLVHNRPRCTDVAKWIWYLYAPNEGGFLRLDGYEVVRRLEDDWFYNGVAAQFGDEGGAG